MSSVKLLLGKNFQDDRGLITYNNDFDADQIRRIYTIENESIDFVRGWQGHKIEQRWFACICGSFEIFVIEVDNFEQPSKDLNLQKFILTANELTYLHIPAGFITAIKAKEDDSKLLVLADYPIGSINDEYRYDLNYFNI